MRGCLVLAYESRVHRKGYEHDEESVAVHTPASLAHELRAEAGREREIDERVATEVWKLGRVAGEPDEVKGRARRSDRNR